MSESGTNGFLPTVSIGMPVYNGGKYLKDALQSILSQTYGDFELIISDNASTDDTMEICWSFGEKDRRIRYFRSENNMGAAWNFNRVFHLSSGKYFQWACHDDVWTSTLLGRCVEILDRDPEVALCCSRTTYIDENSSPTRSLIGRPEFQDRDPSRRFRKFLVYHTLPNECNQVLGLFRADILKKTPLLGSYPATDMILLGEVILHGKFYEIPECLFIRRDHPMSSVNANPGWEERAVWFNPSQRGKIQLHAWRWLFEWMKSVQRSPIGGIERMKCRIIVAQWAKRNRKEMLQDVKHGLKVWIHPDHKRAHN